jgi:hypothetical protein
MIAATPSPPVAYLWEPFSLLHRPGICDAPFRYWFPYVCEENASLYRASIADTLAFRYKTSAELRTIRTPKGAARLVRDRARFARYRRRRAVPVMKDPVAVFSAGWLCDTFDMDVLVLIRHPCAFANSLKRLGWTHPFGHFLAQPLLMRDVLHPFEEEIRAFTARERPPLEQGILLWNLIHHALHRVREDRPDWMFLRLEDIARDPVAAFRDIYARLGLTFTDEVAITVAAHSDPSNPATVARPGDVRRNSRASAVAWKTALTREEIARVRAGVEQVSAEFYSDADW